MKEQIDKILEKFPRIASHYVNYDNSPAARTSMIEGNVGIKRVKDINGASELVVKWFNHEWVFWII